MMNYRLEDALYYHLGLPEKLSEVLASSEDYSNLEKAISTFEEFKAAARGEAPRKRKEFEAVLKDMGLSNALVSRSMIAPVFAF